MLLTKCKYNILEIKVLNSILACNTHVDTVCVFLALHKIIYNENRRIMNFVITYHIHVYHSFYLYSCRCIGKTFNDNECHYFSSNHCQSMRTDHDVCKFVNSLVDYQSVMEVFPAKNKKEKF